MGEKQSIIRDMSRNIYSEDFFKSHEIGALKSAKEIVPLVIELVHPKSVIDIGCGTGVWLSIFKDYGIDDIYGIDGEWVDKSSILIDQDHFLTIDLNNIFDLKRRFDLALCLEVAEHLPRKSASGLVSSLTKLASIILFSAAIPYQGGHNHINEQWPTYWVEHFSRHGFIVLDPFRHKIWDNENVAPWYAQNLLLFAQEDYLKLNKKLVKESQSARQISIIHPGVYLAAVERLSKKC